MTRLLLIALITPLATGCGDQTLQTNTPEYFKAHGIEQGQPNELRIGATLFRFAAGVGLNPYTSQVIVRSKYSGPRFQDSGLSWTLS